MKQGGLIARERSHYVLRVCGFIIPFILLIYGLLVREGFVPSASYISDNFFYALMTTWIALGVAQLAITPKTATESFIRLALFHVLAAGFLLGVSGFSMLLGSFWVLLALGSYVLFTRSGLILSFASLGATAIISSLMTGLSGDTVLDNSLMLTVIIVISLAFVVLTNIQQVDSAALTAAKLQERLQRDSVATLMNNLADGVLSVDSDFKITLYNAASLGLLDTNSTIFGKHIDDIVTLYDGDEQIVRLSKLLEQAKSLTINDTLRITTGEEELRIELNYSPIRSAYSTDTPAESGYIIIMRDITKAKSLEEERDEFISVVSHELRTPLTIAEGTISNVQLLFEKDEINDDLLEDGLKAAHEQIMFLARMVNDLSTLSRAERGIAADIEDIDTKNLVFTLFREYEPEAKKKGLVLDLDTSAKLGHVQTSHLYLRELLQNFVTNAIKYTKKGKVTITAKESQGKILFSVTDTGIGISKTDQANIFRKFYRSEDYRTRETGGTGLGLYVALKLARRLNTEIKLNSRLNYGSTFSFSLPVAFEEKNKATNQTAE